MPSQPRHGRGYRSAAAAWPPHSGWGRAEM